MAVIKNHTLLEWLTFDRALAVLQETADPQMTPEDLLLHCSEHDHCVAYIKPGGMRGFCSQAFACLEPDSRGIVYGVGFHRVLNPEVFAAPAVDGLPRRVLLSGDVLLMPDEDGERFSDVEWEAGAALNPSALLFRKSEIHALSCAINGKNGEIAADSDEIPLAKSQLLTIAALLELLKDRSRPIYTQTRIIEAIHKRHPDWPSVGEDTLKKLFAAANNEKRQVSKSKKLQMQK